MRRYRRGAALLALLLSMSLIAAACGDSAEEGGDDTTTTEAGSDTSEPADLGSDSCGTLPNEDVAAGGEFVDYAQLSDRGSNTSFDPGVVQTLDEAQITNAVWDGLTDFDFSEKCSPELKGNVAESWEANEDATEWTFQLKDGLTFTNGEAVNPSAFKRAWERAGSAELASPYGYLITFIEGGDTLLDGSATTLDSIVADDDAMTLTVTMSAPNADFPAIVNHSFFSPITEEDLTRLGNTTGWGEDGATIGNGPFMIETANTDEVVLVPNPDWAGNVYGDTEVKLDKLTFKITDDVDSAFQAFEGGEGDSATIPSGRYGDAREAYPNTLESPTLGSYFFDIGSEDPQLSGEENTKLRQAISLAINRAEINTKVYEDSRKVADGITPAGIPGREPGACDYCEYDPEGAKDLYDEWAADGGTLDSPIKISVNEGGGHDEVAAIIQANLKDNLGIETEIDLVAEDYFRVIGEPGACQLCRSGWYADYPTYGNFMLDLFGAVSIGGNNLGRFDNPDFEEKLAAAQAETDPEAQGQLYRDAEDILLNQVTAAIPIVYYQGDQVYREGVVNYDQPPLGLILWERIGKQG